MQTIIRQIKGRIILDNANHCHIYNCEVYDVGMEGIHLRDNSSSNIVDMCTITDTGKVNTGYSGANYADSFIDVKGNNAIIRNNTCNRNNNSNIVDAFQGSEQLSGWGKNNDFYSNTVNLDQSSGYVLKITGNTTAKASNNTRIPAGNMYSGNITQY
ncbi:hypothetical protein Cphy_0482 [Lachnoclostridium phytofermentans ISDg]|uniref:Right handed beta helix domain-containing protein n=2 Tax=Lachnoclostridium phytofermentans TaxID=66219 RepID=A9KI35_LACP7|nr:hypothetical protein Cphy_0482 [Lachnoclostridium phytofermentans ISDg]